MKDRIYYNSKLGALVVVTSDEELADLVKVECEKHKQPELIRNRICNVIYQLREKEPDRKQKTIVSLGYILIVVFWVVCFALIVLGVIKFTEILAIWMT